MTIEQIYEKLNRVFIDVFDDETITINGDTTSADIEEWDSLNHITLMSSIEKEFGIKFSMKDVLSIKNVGDLVEKVQNLL